MSAPRGSARVGSDGKVVQQDGKADSEESVTTDDVQDAPKLAKLLTRILSTLAGLRRQRPPRRMDFEDIVVAGTGASVPFAHGFNGRVRWYAVDWLEGSGNPVIPVRDAVLTDANTLYLKFYASGTVCIRVEAV